MKNKVVLKTDTYLSEKNLVLPSDTHNFYLDGVSERLQFPNTTHLSFTNGVNDLPFTMSIRCKPELLGINGALISKQGSGSGDDTDEYGLTTISSGSVRFLLFSGANANYIYIQTTNAIITNQWVTITATYDGSESVNGLEIYIDGVLAVVNRFDSGLYTGMTQYTNGVLFGSRLFGANTKGNISAVSFYNKILSQIEITSFMNGIEPSNITGCMFNMKAGDRAYWDGVNWICPDYNRSTIITASINMEISDKVVN